MDTELEMAAARAGKLRAELRDKQGITAERRREAKASLERLTSVVEKKQAAEQDKKQLDAQQQNEQASGQELIGFPATVAASI
jgi:hypothetical protein